MGIVYDGIVYYVVTDEGKGFPCEINFISFFSLTIKQLGQFTLHIRRVIFIRDSRSNDVRHEKISRIFFGNYIDVM